MNKALIVGCACFTVVVIALVLSQTSAIDGGSNPLFRTDEAAGADSSGLGSRFSSDCDDSILHFVREIVSNPSHVVHNQSVNHEEGC